ncbi:hypothetical protein [Umezawaea sp. NPDC059074]|uniref:hypothetical protein n=1 Tax=Umezawaea sp. NPDC059074 TaxID=3346716 RepID=UPI00369B3F75
MTYPITEEPAEPAPPAPARRRRTGLIALAVVATVLVGAAGTLGFLYFDAKARGAALTAEAADLDQRQLDATGMLLDGNGLLSKARTDASTASNARLKAEATGKKMADCQDAARAMKQADLGGGPQQVFEAAVLKVMSAC